MTNIVIQQIKIADYKNIFLMPITSNYRLIIINPIDPRPAASGRSRGSWSGRPASILLNKKPFGYEL